MASNQVPRLAVVTGASQGIGAQIALELAARGWGLILVARSADKLAAVAESAKREGAPSTVLVEADLGTQQGIDRVVEAFEQGGSAVELLVNNAGFGDTVPFADRDLAHHEAMINLNVVAVTRLLHFAARRFRERGRGRVLNVASTASFQPNPFFAIYGATKAYVLNLGEAVGEELRGTGVTITTLCPGPTKTGFHEIAGTGSSLITKVTILPVAQVAREGVEGVLKGKSVVIPGFVNKVLMFSTRISPRSLLPRISRFLMEPRQPAAR